MSTLSVRHYLQSRNANPSDGVRHLFGPTTRTMSLRSLISSLRVIHLSDLHFTVIPSIDQPQDSEKKRAILEEFLIHNKARLGANIVVITGDITDKGEEDDYKIAKAFIQRLKDNGFVVAVNPGNHDYCLEGTLGIAPPLVIPPLDHLARRKNFIKYISSDKSKFPHIVNFTNGRLILLDSMQEQLDHPNFDVAAQGRLGQDQLAKLRSRVLEYQKERRKGKQLIVSLHHSPFISTEPVTQQEPLREYDMLIGLHEEDRKELLSIVNKNIDCLLFGHTSPNNQDHRPVEKEKPLFAEAEKYYGIPLINCENLESMASKYSVTVLDIGICQRIVFQTDTVVSPDYSEGALIE